MVEWLINDVGFFPHVINVWPLLDLAGYQCEDIKTMKTRVCYLATLGPGNAGVFPLFTLLSVVSSWPDLYMSPLPPPCEYSQYDIFIGKNLMWRIIRADLTKTKALYHKVVSSLSWEGNTLISTPTEKADDRLSPCPTYQYVRKWIHWLHFTG